MIITNRCNILSSGNSTHLFSDIFEGRRGNYGEADQENVCLGVAERSQSVVVLLSSCVKQTQGIGLPADHHCYSIVVKYLGKSKQYNSIQIRVHTYR